MAELLSFTSVSDIMKPTLQGSDQNMMQPLHWAPRSNLIHFAGSQAADNSIWGEATTRTSTFKPRSESDAVTVSHYIPGDLYFPDFLFLLSYQLLLLDPTYRELKCYFLPKREHQNINLNIKNGNAKTVTWTEIKKRTPFMPLVLSWLVNFSFSPRHKSPI